VIFDLKVQAHSHKQKKTEVILSQRLVKKENEIKQRNNYNYFKINGILDLDIWPFDFNRGFFIDEICAIC